MTRPGRNIACPAAIGLSPTGSVVNGARETHAAFRPIVVTAKANDASVYDGIRFALSVKANLGGSR